MRPKLFRSTVDDYYDAAMRDYPWLMKLMLAFAASVVYLFTKIMWRWQVDDYQKLKPRDPEKGSVIICNHTSMGEVASLYVHLYFQGRRARFIYKSEFDNIRIARWFFSRIGAIVVNRGTADMKCLRRAQHALERGEDVVIFPEGTRIRTDDQPVEIHGGFALMAEMGHTDVIPMAVCGFRDITPNGKHLMRPVKCWMRVGDRLCLDDAPAELKRRKDKTKWMEDEGMRRVYEVRDGLREEHPGRR